MVNPSYHQTYQPVPQDTPRLIGYNQKDIEKLMQELRPNLPLPERGRHHFHFNINDLARRYLHPEPVRIEHKPLPMPRLANLLPTLKPDLSKLVLPVWMALDGGPWAGPIFRYGDERLYGSSLVKPFRASYAKLRNSLNPLHSSDKKITEIGCRVLQAGSALAGMAISAPRALAGRVTQIAHYHLLPTFKREHPPVVKVTVNPPHRAIEICPAPIEKYSDSRLFGSSPVESLIESGQRLKALSTKPLNHGTQKGKIVEAGARALQGFKCIADMVATAPFALIGSVARVAHFHLLSKPARQNPSNINEACLSLPDHKHLSKVNKFDEVKGVKIASAADTKKILREGFGSLDLESAQAPKFALDATSAPIKGQNQLEVTFSLDPRELVSISKNDWDAWLQGAKKAYSKEKTFEALESEQKQRFYKAVKELFIQNGFRGIVVKESTAVQSLIVFDASSIHLKKVS